MDHKPEGCPKSFPEPASAVAEPRAAPVRVLVVDDYEPFRRFVCSTLKKRSGLEIVGEALDGLEAVQKVEELQPDLIVLDIGLPTVNGIEAARRIRKSRPECKILFLSQESSADVAQEGFRLGALAYVVKAHAGSELLAAAEAVCEGRQFISKGISGYDYTSTTDVHVSSHSLCTAPPLSLVPERRAIDRNHAVQFYSDDESFLVGFAGFIEAALKTENAVIVVATESHRNSLFRTLQARGLDIDAAIEQGRCISLDVAQMLSNFMVNDLPDRTRFLKVAGDLVAAAAKGEHPRISACGECAPTLWAQGKADAAVQLEHLWDEIAKTCNIDILCGYVLTDFQREQESHIHQKICTEHSTVYSR
jgi:DNA-binding NarL/FixJ family response regulator